MILHLYVFKTATFALYNIKSLFFITEVESVYHAVWTEPVNNVLFLKG